MWTGREIRRTTKVFCLPTLDGCPPKMGDCLRLFGGTEGGKVQLFQKPTASLR